MIAADILEFSLEEVKRSYGDIIPQTQVDRRMFVLKQVNLWFFHVKGMIFILNSNPISLSF